MVIVVEKSIAALHIAGGTIVRATRSSRKESQKVQREERLKLRTLPFIFRPVA
jgi:hypothetical protein